MSCSYPKKIELRGDTKRASALASTSKRDYTRTVDMIVLGCTVCYRMLFISHQHLSARFVYVEIRVALKYLLRLNKVRTST